MIENRSSHHEEAHEAINYKYGLCVFIPSYSIVMFILFSIAVSETVLVHNRIGVVGASFYCHSTGV